MNNNKVPDSLPETKIQYYFQQDQDKVFHGVIPKLSTSLPLGTRASKCLLLSSSSFPNLSLILVTFIHCYYFSCTYSTFHVNC